jgi:hypothetical protein
VNLMRADALFRSGHEEQRSQPLGQRNFAALEHGANRHSELLTAGRFVALVHAWTVRLAFKLGDFVLIGIATMRADPALGPNAALKPIAGFGFVLKDRVFE